MKLYGLLWWDTDGGMWYTYALEHYLSIREGNTVICDKVDDNGGFYAKWNKHRQTPPAVFQICKLSVFLESLETILSHYVTCEESPCFTLVKRRDRWMQVTLRQHFKVEGMDHHRSCTCAHLKMLPTTVNLWTGPSLKEPLDILIFQKNYLSV